MPRGGERPNPPALLRWLTGKGIPREERESVLVEMDHLWRSRRHRQGPLRAWFWYLGTALGFAVRVRGAGILGGAGRWTRDAVADLRYGARVLARRPGYAAAAVLTLGLGVGGLTSVYAAADRVLLRPVPGVEAPHELITLRLGSSEMEGAWWTLSHADLEALRVGVAGVRSLDARTALEVNVSFDQGAGARRTRAAVVTPGWFETLGVRFAAGRAPVASPDPAASGAGEVVLSSELARAMAGSVAGALGRTVEVDGVAHTVVGVTGPGFQGAELPGETGIWLGPAGLLALDPSAPDGLFQEGYQGIWQLLVARPVPGQTVAGVAAAAERVRERAVEQQLPSAAVMVAHFEMQAFPGVGLDPSLRSGVRRTVALLAAGAAFLLLLAGANVANLAITHAASRRGATSVRRALGAGRGRLLRQLLAEHLVMGAGGALAGLAFAWVGIGLLRDVRLQEYGAALTGLALDPRVAGVAVLLALGTSLLAAAGAAAASGGGNPEALRGARSGTRSGHRLRAGLAALQIGLSAVLVVGAGLLGRTVANLRGLDLGFRPDGVLAVDLDPSRVDRDAGEVSALLARLVSALEARPEVAAAGFASPEPLRTSFLTSWLGPLGGDPDDGILGAHLQVAGPFLEAMGVPLLAGRAFGEGRWMRSGDDGEPEVVVNRSAARELFPDRTPAQVVGEVVSTGRGDAPPVRIVGVMEDLALTGPRPDRPHVFVRPWGQGYADQVAVGWVRAREGADPAALAPLVREVVAGVDPTLPVFDVRTVRTQADRMFADERVLAGLGTVVSLLGLLVAAVGIHGVLGYTVQERRREIGVRAALGADTSELLGRVLAGGLGIALAGMLPGLMGAWGLTRFLESRLYGVAALDPWTWGVGTVVLVGVALLASLLPALRATRVPVVEVLRAEG